MTEKILVEKSCLKKGREIRERSDRFCPYICPVLQRNTVAYFARSIAII